MSFKKWLNKGEGGEWYEPFVTNGDMGVIVIITIIVSSIIIFGFYLIK
jgi:hypothetical protein